MRISLKGIWGLLKETFRGFKDDKCTHLAAALSYYTVFSLAPMLLVIIASASFFLGDQRVRIEIFNYIQGAIGTEAAQAIERMIEQAYKPRDSMWATGIGLFTVLIGASAIFSHLQVALNSIWNVKTKPKRAFLKMIQDRLLSFGMVLAMGFLLLVSLVLSAATAALGDYIARVVPGLSVVALKGFEFAMTLLLTTSLFAMMFKFLPDVRSKWKDVWVGASFTAFLFEIGKIGISFYLGKTAPQSAFGAAGALVVVMLWVYYSSLIFFIGAEFTEAYSKAYGTGILPKEYASKVIKPKEREVPA